jgi:hypothetical protein
MTIISKVPYVQLEFTVHVYKYIKEVMSSLETHIALITFFLETGTDRNCTDSSSSALQGGCKLSLGDRVVWLLENDRVELGTVQWLGLMHDGIVAGVEFVSQVQVSVKRKIQTRFCARMFIQQ